MAFCAPLLLLVSFCITSQIHAAPSGTFGIFQPWFEVQKTLEAVLLPIGQKIGVMGTSGTNACQYSDQNWSYSCCYSITGRAVCVVVTYLPSNVGFSVNFTFDGNAVYQEEISVKNPQSICLKDLLPIKLAQVCPKFYDIDWGNKMVKGCFRVEVKISYWSSWVDFGCFSLGPFVENEKKETNESAEAVQNNLTRLEKQSDNFK